MGLIDRQVDWKERDEGTGKYKEKSMPVLPELKNLKVGYPEVICDYCNQPIQSANVKTRYYTGGTKDIVSNSISMPFICRICGGSFCADHRLPENHECGYRTIIPEGIQDTYAEEELVNMGLISEDDESEENYVEHLTEKYNSKHSLKNIKVIIFLILIGISGYLITPHLIGVEDISESSDFNPTIETFLMNDLTDNQKFELKSMYAKTLYENAYNNEFILGGIILHTGNNNYKDDTRYVLNYYIKGDSFFIVNPKTDKVYTLSEFSNSPDFPKNYKYLTLFPDVKNMPDYKLTKQTRDFDRENPIDSVEMIKKVNMIYIYQIAEEIQQEEPQQDTQWKYPTNFLDSIEHEVSYFIAQLEQEFDEYEKSSELKQQYTSKRVYSSYDNAYIVGAKGDVKYLNNNENAVDVSYSEMISFVLKDDTDKMKYSYSSFVCADYAEMLHNNAENAGIKSAYVIISATGTGHALNAFNTIDKGLIYIDSTGSLDGISMDSIAVIKNNGIYYESMGYTDYYTLPSYMDIKDVEVIW